MIFSYHIGTNELNVVISQHGEQLNAKDQDELQKHQGEGKVCLLASYTLMVFYFCVYVSYRLGASLRPVFFLKGNTKAFHYEDILAAAIEFVQTQGNGLQ